jgi:hypothetical protein
MAGLHRELPARYAMRVLWPERIAHSNDMLQAVHISSRHAHARADALECSVCDTPADLVRGWRPPLCSPLLLRRPSAPIGDECKPLCVGDYQLVHTSALFTKSRGTLAATVGRPTALRWCLSVVGRAR